MSVTDLIGTYQTGIEAIYRRIGDLYERGAVLFDNDEDIPNLALAKPPESGRLNREAYLWTLKAIGDLQGAINALVGVFNANGIVDYDKGDTATLALWQPHRLAIDSTYLSKLQGDFDACNQLLDALDAMLRQVLPE